MTPVRVFSHIATDLIGPNDLMYHVQDDAAGAYLTFAGAVRNHDKGKAVASIEYSSHPKTADILEAVANKIADEYAVHHIGVIHRVGHLVVGDIALLAAVSASHRSDALGAMAALIDTIKAEVPIWKKQWYTDGTGDWSQCS